MLLYNAVSSCSCHWFLASSVPIQEYQQDAKRLSVKRTVAAFKVSVECQFYLPRIYPMKRLKSLGKSVRTII